MEEKNYRNHHYIYKKYGNKETYMKFWLFNNNILTDYNYSSLIIFGQHLSLER